MKTISIHSLSHGPVTTIETNRIVKDIALLRSFDCDLDFIQYLGMNKDTNIKGFSYSVSKENLIETLQTVQELNKYKENLYDSHIIENTNDRFNADIYCKETMKHYNVIG